MARPSSIAGFHRNIKIPGTLRMPPILDFCRGLRGTEEIQFDGRRAMQW